MARHMLPICISNSKPNINRNPNFNWTLTLNESRHVKYYWFKGCNLIILLFGFTTAPPEPFFALADFGHTAVWLIYTISKLAIVCERNVKKQWLQVEVNLIKRGYSLPLSQYRPTQYVLHD